MGEGVYCFILCFGFLSGDAKAAPVDTFCQTYTRVVVNKSELDDVLKLPRKLRDRIQGNDLDYLCRCAGWNTRPDKKTLCASTRP